MKRLMVNKALGETVLHRAARLGYTDVVLYCLETKYVDVNSRDNAGYTPLHESCSRGHVVIARYLLAHGADVNAAATGGIRPIHDAMEHDHLETVRLLLTYGADPLLATYAGATPLKIARSPEMSGLIKGFLSDVTGEGDTCILPWQFDGSSRRLDPAETGYDVLDDVPSDSDDASSDDEELLFEASEKPLVPTYHVRVPGSPDTWSVQHYCLLSDVLRDTGLSRDQYHKQHRTAEHVTIKRGEFTDRTVCAQLGVNPSPLPSTTKDTVELVKLDDDLREMLGIESIVIPSSPV
jgi:hypothetical protein